MAQHVVSAIVDPSSAPAFIGMHYVNTLTKQTWLSVGTSSVGDWFAVGSGGGGGIVLETKISLTSTDLDTGNSIPIEAIAAPGAGFAIHLMSAAYRCNFVSSTNGSDVQLWNPTAVDAQAFCSGSPSAYFGQFEITSKNTRIVENEPLNIKFGSDAGSPSDSTADVYIAYRIITL